MSVSEINENPGSTAASAPVDFFIVDDLETIKVIADPFRHRLLTLLGEPRSVKQLAAEVDRPPDRLYYHLNKLIDAGLVVEVTSRLVNGITERTWQIVGPIKVDASRIEDRSITDSLVANSIRMINDGLSDPGPSEGPVRSTLAMSAARVPPAVRPELAERIRTLIDEYCTDADDAADGEWLAVFSGFYVVPDHQRDAMEGDSGP